jgi:DNA-binding Xre family transcriptional regulator
MKLKIQAVAAPRGITIAELSRETKITLGTIRRYWYSSSTGLERDAGTLGDIHLPYLQRIADYLNIKPIDLIE